MAINCHFIHVHTTQLCGKKPNDMLDKSRSFRHIAMNSPIYIYIYVYIYIPPTGPSMKCKITRAEPQGVHQVAESGLGVGALNSYGVTKLDRGKKKGGIPSLVHLNTIQFLSCSQLT